MDEDGGKSREQSAVRKARVAAELRANLLKRKAQQRARTSGEKDAGRPEGPGKPAKGR